MTRDMEDIPAKVSGGRLTSGRRRESGMDLDYFKSLDNIYLARIKDFQSLVMRSTMSIAMAALFSDRPFEHDSPDLVRIEKEDVNNNDHKKNKMASNTTATTKPQNPQPPS
ncbi:Uncharacterized protein Fot_01988 [Forsythia ovata]|uniref:Uncharacterized protein n=1 Tax=Forsythia ovata TaxID=205694 RepID=A0ABD1X5K4_9LAMI